MVLNQIYCFGKRLNVLFGVHYITLPELFLLFVLALFGS